MKKVLLVTMGLAVLVAFAGAASADCADLKLTCVKIVNGKIFNDGSADVKGDITVGQCWKSWGCEICEDEATHARRCNSQYPQCEGNCARCWRGVLKPGLPCYDKDGRVYNQ